SVDLVRLLGCTTDLEADLVESRVEQSLGIDEMAVRASVNEDTLRFGVRDHVVRLAVEERLAHEVEEDRVRVMLDLVDDPLEVLESHSACGPLHRAGTRLAHRASHVAGVRRLD